MMHEKFLSYEVTLGSPGHEEMLWWPHPVRPGDTLNGSITIKGVKISKSKPDLGFIRYEALLKSETTARIFNYEHAHN